MDTPKSEVNFVTMATEIHIRCI